MLVEQGAQGVLIAEFRYATDIHERVRHATQLYSNAY